MMILHKTIRAVAAIVIYLVIDVGWNVSPIAVGMYESLYEASGNAAMFDQFGREMSDWGLPQIAAILLFMILIGFANAYLAIEPALKKNDLLTAVKNSIVLGCAAYATYIVPIYFTIKTWPGALVPIDIIIGGCLSLITSTIVTYVALRMRNRAAADSG